MCNMGVSIYPTAACDKLFCRRPGHLPNHGFSTALDLNCFSIEVMKGAGNGKPGGVNLNDNTVVIK